MKNLISKYVLNLANVFFVLTILAFSLPSRYTLERSVGLKPFYPFLIVLITVELFFLFNLRAVEKNRTAKDIAAFVFGFLFLWELAISRFNLIPYIYVPAPENVFYIFISDYRKIIQGFFSSMFLLIIGMATSLTSAVFLGTLVGWIPRLRKAIYPIVKAISTVPPLVYTPYIVLIMPSYRSASIVVIFLTVFWNVFMGSINNTAFVEKKIINAARVLNLSTPTILFKIIIPFNYPRIINALPINLSAAIMTLTVAEMLGAESGMGYYVRYALAFTEFHKAIGGIIFIAIVVTVINALISLVQKYTVKWKY